MLGSGLSDFRSHYHPAVRVTGVIREVIVMVILSYEEVDQWTHFSHDGGIIESGRFGYSILNTRLLLLIRIECSASILRPYVVTLTIQLRRIVTGEEDLEQGRCVYGIGIEEYSDYLSMSGALTAYLLVCRVLDMPS